MDLIIFLVSSTYYRIKIIISRNIDIVIKLTELYEKRKSYDKGLQILSQFKRNHTLNIDELYRINYRIAYFTVLLGDVDLAISRFEDLYSKISEGEKPSQYLLASLIELYNRKKAFNKSIKIIQEYLVDPTVIDDEYLLFNGGNTFLGLKQYTTAFEYFSQAIQLEPFFKDEIYYNMGLCKYYLLDYPDSIHLFNESLQLSDRKDKVAEIYYALGIAYKDWNDNDSALDHFHKADKLGYEKAKKGIEEIKNSDSIL